ncbi:MAG: transporter substrate-binding domain-containing protein [Burkholderiaceae bacterium]
MIAKKIAVFALAGASMMAAFGVRADALQNIQQRGTLLVGVDIGAPPYGMVDSNARQTGFDIDSAKSLAEYLGVKLEVVPVTGPTRVQFLRTNKVDAIMASFSITDERKKVIDFSEPYGVVPVVVGGPKAAKITSAKDLAGKAIAVTRGTTSDQVITKSTKDVPGVSIVRYQDDATTNTAVLTGQQDYIVAAASVLPEIVKSDPKRDVVYKYTAVSFPMGVGLRQGEPQLKAKVNEWVAKNLKNGKLNDIYKKYFIGQSLPEEMLK